MAFVPQVVNDVTEFYKQTYDNYKATKQEALKQTLRLIHFGVRTQKMLLFPCRVYKHETNPYKFKMGVSVKLQSSVYLGFVSNGSDN